MIHVTFNGETYDIPSPGELDWASSLNAYLVALSAAQVGGGVGDWIDLSSEFNTGWSSGNIDSSAAYYFDGTTLRVTFRGSAFSSSDPVAGSTVLTLGEDIRPSTDLFFPSWYYNGFPPPTTGNAALRFSTGTGVVDPLGYKHVTGATSGADGILLYDAIAGATGVIYFSSITGTFQDGEVLSCPSSWTGVAVGTQYSLSASPCVVKVGANGVVSYLTPSGTPASASVSLDGISYRCVAVAPI